MNQLPTSEPPPSLTEFEPISQANSSRDAASLQSERPPAQPSKKGLVWRVRGVIKTMRPHQWVKNAFVLAPVIFAKDFFNFELLKQAFGAFGVFCLLAGAVYTMNDIVDVEADRVHPVKRFRPIPSGQVPLSVAKALAAALVLISIGGALTGPIPFVIVAASYFLINIAYSFKLKKIAYLDVGCIAAGFVLRVVAGGFATGIYVSGYLLVCTALLALFLAFGKRRHELAQVARGNVKKQRAVLQAYSPRALTVALSLTGVATIVTYVAYTLNPFTRAFFHTDYLWLTTPFTIFGVARFVFLVVRRPKAESPTQEMLRDVPFVTNLIIWGIVVFAIVYRLRPAEMP